MNLKNLVANTIGMGGFIIVNKALIKYFGENDTPIALSFIIDKWKYFECEDFYYKISDLMEDCQLSERKAQSSIKKLIEMGILVKKGFIGLPPKQYYNINTDKLIEILNNEIYIPCKNGGDKCYNDKNQNKNGVVKCSDFVGDIYRNNTINNNKDDFSNEKSYPPTPQSENQKSEVVKNKNNPTLLTKKPKTKKELLDYAIAIYNQAKENNPNLALTFEAWSDWVEYKLLKEAKITYKTFELNLKKLVEYGDDANKIIEQSISNNWSGLFDLKKFEKKSDVDIYSQMVNDLSDKPDDWREFEEYQL